MTTYTFFQGSVHKGRIFRIVEIAAASLPAQAVSRVAVVCESELPVGTTDGGNACVLFARYGEGGTEVVGPIFFGE